MDVWKRVEVGNCHGATLKYTVDLALHPRAGVRVVDQVEDEERKQSRRGVVAGNNDVIMLSMVTESVSCLPLTGSQRCSMAVKTACCESRFHHSVDLSPTLLGRVDHDEPGGWHPREGLYRSPDVFTNLLA